MSEMEKQLAGYRLTTAEILYHMPDHPGLLQTFVWQALDLAPRYPRMMKFLKFWEDEIDGRLHSVRIAGGGIIKPAGLSACDARLTLH